MGSRICPRTLVLQEAEPFSVDSNSRQTLPITPLPPNPNASQLKSGDPPMRLGTPWGPPSNTSVPRIRAI
ncbi:MAG: hypothetical protein ACRDEA_19040, partial [Microcystaceae cyanobacterium]